MVAEVLEDKKRPIEDQCDGNSSKRPRRGRRSRLRRYKNKDIDETSPLGVLQLEIKELLEKHNLTKEDVMNDMSAILNDPELLEKYNNRIISDVKVLALTSNGDSLAIIPLVDPERKQIVLIPFALPDDVVTIKVHKSHPMYVEADLLSIEKSTAMRNNELINCRYFGKCSGCQFQNIEYQQQLAIKKQTIINAYDYFAPKLVSQKLLPEVLPTQESPLTYNYRTKLTPHFYIPNKKTGKDLPCPPNLGIASKGRPTWRKSDFGPEGTNIDIEECNIGTKIINQGLANERRRFNTEYVKYSKGATFLLREDTKVLQEDTVIGPGSVDENGQVSKIEVELEDNTKLVKTCVTQTRQIVQEYINGYIFEFSAGLLS